MKKLLRIPMFLFLILAFQGFAGSATALTYLPGIDASTFYDAEKTGGDSAMCWAAAASNILAWSQWGAQNTDPALSDGGDEDAIFSYLKTDYGNTDGKSKDAWADWFGKPGLESYTFGDYFTEIAAFNTDYTVPNYDSDPNYVRYTDDRLRDFIDDDYGTVLSMQKRYDGTGLSHALTVWGYDDLNFDDDQIIIWVTDSDHDPDTLTQYTLYRGYSLLSDPTNNPNEWYWDIWYNPYTSGLNGINDSWWVTGLQGLLAFDDAGNGNPPVPEPGTLLLLGAGLVGIAGLGRKKFFKK